MKFRALLLLGSLISVSFTPGVSASSDCGHCYVKEEALATLHKAEDDYLELLKKNNDYLQSLKPDETSKAIKLRSNITMINIQLSGVRDNIVSAHVELDKQCKECREPAASE